MAIWRFHDPVSFDALSAHRIDRKDIQKRHRRTTAEIACGNFSGFSCTFQ